MTVSNADGNQSTVTTEGSTVTESVESFVSAVADALADSEANSDAVEAVRETGNELADDVADLEARVEATDEENEELREELSETRREQAEIRSDIHELGETVESQDNAGTTDEESGSDDETPTLDDDETAVPEAKTSLEETIRLPQHVADDALTANEQRARSVARGIEQYADHNHRFGNYSLTATTLRKVLTAQSDDGQVHHQTVKRVRQFLTRLGGSAVTITEDTGGTKRVVFSESLVERIEAWSDAHSGVRAETGDTGVRP